MVSPHRPDVPHGPLSGSRRVVLSFSMWWVVTAVVAVTSWGVVGTRALFQVSATVPANSLQAASVRIVSNRPGEPVFDAASMLPGEVVERDISLRNAGSVPVDISLIAVPEAGDSSQLTATIEQCLTGPWMTVTPSSAAVGVERPHRCSAATPGVGSTAVVAHSGALVSRGQVVAGTPTTTPVPVAVARGVNPGGDAHVRVRVGQPEGATTSQRASVRFEWVAQGVTTNLQGTPLAAEPIAALGTVVPPPVPSVTIASGQTPQPTPFPVPTATTAFIDPPLNQLPGYALALEGGFDGVSIPWGTVAGLASRASWTFEAWLKPDDLTGTRVVYAEAAPVPSSMKSVLAIRLVDGVVQAGTWRGDRSGDGWSWCAAPSTKPLITGVWQHLAVTWAGDASVSIAIDGVALGSGVGGTVGRLDGTDVPSSTGWLGRGPGYDVGAGFVGSIDEIRMWDGIRTTSELTTNRQLRLQGNEVGLVAYFPIGVTEGRGVSLVDASGHAVPATLTGGVRWVPSAVPMTAVAPLGFGNQWREVTITNTGTSPLKEVPIRIDNAFTSVASDPSTIAAWTFDETDGDSVEDLAGKQSNGTIIGAFARTQGVSGNGLALNGAGYVDAGNGPAVVGTGPFTVQAWFRTSFGAAQVIAQQRSVAAYNGEWQLGLDSGGRITWWSYGDGAYGAKVTSSNTYANNVWHHVTATREADGTGKVYVDGGLDGQQSSQARNLVPTTVYIGADVRDDKQFFVGSLDDVRIINRALAASEAASAAIIDAPGLTVRITDEGNHPVPFWREQAGTYWVRPSIAAGASQVLRFHWGNPANSDASDGAAVFDDFDGFSGTSLDSNRWQVVNQANGSIGVAGGTLTITAAGDWWEMSDTAASVVARTPVGVPYIAEALITTWIGKTSRIFGVRASTSNASAFLALVNDSDASNATIVYRDGTGQTAGWAGEESGVPRIAFPSLARFDVSLGSVTARYGGRIAGSRTVPDWTLTLPAFTASHGYTSAIEWYRVRRLPPVAPTIGRGAERANPGPGI